LHGTITTQIKNFIYKKNDINVLSEWVKVASQVNSVDEFLERVNRLENKEEV